MIAEQVKDYLERWGYDMVCVKDFQNVLKDFSQAQPHLVLMDNPSSPSITARFVTCMAS